jgi:exopolyphosphatase
MINKTAEQTSDGFFTIDTEWAHENQVDIAILLTSFKNKSGDKVREIVLTVRSGHRIDEKEAERLFNDVKKDIEASEELELTPWNGGQELGKWRYAWTHGRDDGGRKVVRPIVEQAVRRW